MLIKNAKIFKDNNQFEIGDIYIQGSQIVECCDCEQEHSIIDATDLYAIPGLTDIHFHGCAGFDFCDGTKEALDAITQYQLSNGVTTICPATMTLPEESLINICKNARDYSNDNGSIICGINLEGPFLSEKKKGAQNAAYLHKPDPEMFRRLKEASGDLVKMISIAPELEGAMAFISEVNGEVVLSVAHTTADYDTSLDAFQKGASHVTHLYNAMPPFHHRDPGVIGAAYDSPRCTVEMICDGIHLHPSVVRATIQMFGKDRVVFVSDSMMACGLPDGTYALGGQEVNVTGKTARLSCDGAIAGSVTNLMNCLRTAVNIMGVPLETAVQAATINPTKVIGVDHEYGSITVGKMANIILLDQELNIKGIIFKGKRL
jgi:N-acetylglucosamine-6-phosphate deacetylase